MGRCEPVVPSTFIGIFDENPTPMMIYDLDTAMFLEVNLAAIEFYGYSREEFLTIGMEGISPPEDRLAFQERLAFLRVNHSTQSLGVGRHICKNGKIIDVQVASSHDVPYEDIFVSVAVIFDITEHTRRIEELRMTASALEQAQDLGEMGYSLLDLQTGNVVRSDRMLKMMDVTEKEAAGLPLLGIVSPADKMASDILADAKLHNLPVDLTYRVIINGEDRWWHVVSSIIRNTSDVPTHRLATVHDVTSFQEQANRLRWMAYTDEVTGLPNRRSLFEWKAPALPATILLVHFSLVGDLGAKADEECWRIVSQILGYSLPYDAHFSRFTDEIFAISCNIDKSGAASIAAAILAAFERPVVVEEQDVLLVVNIGIATTDKDVATDTLVRNARTALRGALSSSRYVEFHSVSLDLILERRTILERHLRTAAFDDSLAVEYQPIISLLNGRVVGAEALMRWNCEGLGMVSPVEFIPIAEDNGMVLSLGDWILRKACFQARRWQQDGLTILRMAVNISGRQAERLDFSEIVSQALAAANLSSDFIDLEITETAMMNSHEIAVDNFSMLRSRGFRVSMDDFGTGYSSLSALGNLPVDVVKLDRSFVSELTKSGFTAQVVKGIIELAHSGGLRVIAEGVETVEQLAALRLLRCDEAQGFLFGRSLPPERFVTEYLESDYIPSLFTSDPIPLFREA